MTITITTAVLFLLASYRLTRLVTTDDITAPLRDKIWSRFPPDTRTGYLITCDWCSSIYTASLLVFLYMIVPVPATVLFLVLAGSAAAGIISTCLDRL